MELKWNYRWEETKPSHRFLKHILFSHMTRLNLVKRAKFQKWFFWCFFNRKTLSRVDLIIKVVLEFLSDP